MNFLELVKKRHSVRHYAQQVVEKEKLDYILDCARLAPSAVNKQPWTFIVVQSDSQKQKLAKCYPAKWFTEAPVYIVVCVNTDIAWKRQFDNKNHADIDGAITTEHICLAAAEQGLGTCWVCNFDVAMCKENLDLEAYIQPIAIIPIGHPISKEHQLSTRKEINEIVSYI